jgi:hypothetical protein
MLNRARQEGVISTIMHYIKLGFELTSVYIYILVTSSSRNDSHYVPKAKRATWGNAMINVISRMAYSAGDKIMQIAEWAIDSDDGKPSREYARINRLKNSAIRAKRSAVKGRIIMSFLAMSLVAMQSAARPLSEREVRFDSDSHLVGIDNRCSKCISPDPLDFVGKVENTSTSITGFGGSRVIGIKRGTLRWHWEDDTGQVHQFNIQIHIT